MLDHRYTLTQDRVHQLTSLAALDHQLRADRWEYAVQENYAMLVQIAQTRRFIAYAAFALSNELAALKESH